MTVTSSRISLSDFKMTLKEGATATSCVCIPTNEITRVFAELQYVYLVGNKGGTIIQESFKRKCSPLGDTLYMFTIHDNLLI